MKIDVRTFTMLLAIVATGATSYAQHKISVPINTVGSATAPDIFTADSTAFLQAENTALMLSRNATLLETKFGQTLLAGNNLDAQLPAVLSAMALLSAFFIELGKLPSLAKVSAQ